MRYLIQSLFAAAAIAAPTSLATTAMAAEELDSVVVRYFKDRVERPLDVAQVAVHAPEGARAALELRLEALRIDPLSVRELSHGDLFLVSVPPEDRSAAGVRALIADLLVDPEIPFATPVTLDELGAPRFALPAILVQFVDRVGPAEAAAIVAASGIGQIVEFDRQPGNVHLVRPEGRNGFDVLAAVASLAEHPSILFAECDEVIRVFPALIPNDQFFGNQWQLNNTGQFVGAVADIDLNAPQAWDLHTGSASMIVAVLDDGIQQNHPDINQLTPGSNMTNVPGGNGGPLFTYDNHGTAVAGLISATMNNGIGVAGICPGCRTVSIKIAYDTTESWGWTSQSSWIADGVWEAVARGAKITNSSFVSGSAGTITNAYNLTNGVGILHFGAAGNDSQNSVDYPSSLGSVNAVTAITFAGVKAGFSNWGAGTMFCGPGESVYTTDRTGSAGYGPGSYDWFGGTSAASPLVAGTAALVWSAKPSLTKAEVLSILQSTAMDLGANGYDTVFGHGLPRADAAVIEALFGSVCPGAGNCYASNGSPGCAVNSCCLAVCTQDPFCCNVTWDGICANAALDICTNCGAANAGSCYASNGSPGCNQEDCCSAICAVDPFCCNTTWDGLCAGQTSSLCVPENNTCANAIALTTGVSKSFNTTLATTTGPAHPGCDYFGDDQIHKDVWYTWTASCDAYMTVSTCGTANFDTKLAVYGPGFFGGTCPSASILFSGVLLACNDDVTGCAGNTSKIVLLVEAGTTYRIRVGGYNGQSGTGSVLVTCGIPNDVCADALTIFDGSTPFSTIGAATDGPAIADCDGAAAVAITRDIWFRYVATCSGPLTVSTCNDATFDTKLAVWGPGIFGGTCPSAGLLGGQLLGCRDDTPGCSGWTTTLTVDVVAGSTYRIQVGGFNNQSGTGVLTLTCGGCEGDLNGDDVVNAADLTILLGQWGISGSADLNGDNVVNAADLTILLGAWGGCT